MTACLVPWTQLNLAQARLLDAARAARQRGDWITASRCLARADHVEDRLTAIEDAWDEDRRAESFDAEAREVARR